MIIIIGHTKSTIIVYILVILIIIPLVQAQNSSTTPNPTRLRIALPVRSFGYNFVKIETDPITGEPSYSGFAIEVFQAANRALSQPYQIDFFPMQKLDGTMNGTFDDMLKAVYNQEYEGAAGDIGIADYRTEWVDFTLPYIGTGISMLVPFKNPKTTTISLRNVTNAFVASTLAFSILVAIAFCFLEYRNSKKLASKTQHANSRPLSNDNDWCREMMHSMIQTRLVIILLFMLLLIFIACYGASQTSSFSKQHQLVHIKNLDQLIRENLRVGYQKGSFIRNILILNGLRESQLVEFNSEQEMLDLTDKSPRRGGVAAIVGLTVNLKLMQAQRCDSFAFVPSFYLDAAGYGFAFQRGSSLTREFSNGILKVIDNGRLRKIQDRTIGDLNKCKEDDIGVESDQFIKYDTLWILISGAIGVLLLMVIISIVHAGITCNYTTTQ